MRKRKPEVDEGETDAIGVTIQEDERDARPFVKMIKDALRVDEEWQTICDDIEKLYGSLEELAGSGRDRRFQIFYANIEVTKNVIYARPPKPTAVGRFNDRRPIIRSASEIMERTLTTSFEMGKVHEEVLVPIRDNVALFARGVPWMRYYAKGSGKAFSEKVCWDWIHRRDFIHDPARCWYGRNGVQWVAIREFYTERQGRKRFNTAGREDGRDDTGRYTRQVWEGVTYNSKSNDRDEDYKFQRKAEVWQMWNKETGKVYWIHLDKEELLDVRSPADVLADLENFFPCPKPAYGAREVDTLRPLPDVLEYKDQLEEINALTRRMGALTHSLKLKGFYPAGVEELGKAIERLFAEEDDDRAIMEGLSNFAAIGGGTLAQSVVWLPITDVINAIKACVELRRQLIEDVFQISGINDIMRGTVDPNEKLGQTEMKGQYGSVRIREKQAELVRIADDMLAMQGEVIAEQFQPQTIQAMSQVQLPSHQDIQAQLDQATAQLQQVQAAAAQAAQQAQMAPPAQPGGAPQPGQPGMKPTASGAPPGPDPAQAAQAAIGQLQKQIQTLQQTVTFEAVIQLFREQKIRPFMLKVATDSTIAPDENAEKRQRTEFVAALGQLLPQLAAMIMQNPGSVSFAIEILKFATAPYRAGRELEGSIDDFSETVKQTASAPKPPSPEEIKAKGEEARTAADLKGKEMDQAAAAAKAKREEEAAARDARAALEERSAKAQEQLRRDELAVAQAAADNERLRLQGEAEARKNAHEAAKWAHEEKMAKLAHDKGLLDLDIAKHRVTEAKTPKPNGQGDSHVR